MYHRGMLPMHALGWTDSLLIMGYVFRALALGHFFKYVMTPVARCGTLLITWLRGHNIVNGSPNFFPSQASHGENSISPDWGLPLIKQPVNNVTHASKISSLATNGSQFRVMSVAEFNRQVASKSKKAAYTYNCYWDLISLYSDWFQLRDNDTNMYGN